jgi:hypothetical protein
MAGLHDYDHHYPDHSPEGLRERGAWLRDFDQRLVTSVAWQELPTAQRVDFRLLRSRLAVARAQLEELKDFERNPVLAAETALYGIFLLMARPFAPLEERKEALLARLMSVGDYLEGAAASLGKVPPLFLEIAAEVNGSGPGFVDEVMRQLARAFPREAERIEHAGSRARVGFLQYQALLDREVRARAGGSVASGERWMDWRLGHEHLVGYTCAELDALGREHIARLHEELDLEAQAIAPGRSWREQIGAARTRHPEPLRVREAYLAEVERARAFVAAKHLAPLPPVDLDVVDTPVFQRPTTPIAAYLPPAPFDEVQSGWLFVTPVEVGRPREVQERQLGGHCLAALPLIVVHETWPGHHLQITTAHRHGSRLRRLSDNPLLQEGWALCCEELMHEQGFYTDPVSRLYQLRDLLWRACRVVVDVGLHTGRLAVREAVDFLVEHAMLERSDAEAEVKRYALTPTRPLSFLLGKILLCSLRDETRRRLGARFNLHDFHAALLASGSLPPSLIREELAERLT